MTRQVKALSIAATLFAIALPSCQGQAAAKPSYVATMTFDVASVRENKDADPNAGIAMSGNFVPHTATVRLINWTIDNLISYAYNLDQYQLVGVPKWPWPTVFVVEAKGDSEADARIAALTKEQQQAERGHMLQVLLQDRFKLKTHWETRDGVLYHLVVAKGGPKLHAGGSMPPSTDEQKTFGDHSVPKLYQRNDDRGYDFIAHGASIAQLADTLAGQFGSPVIDETSLTGSYDFVLKYSGRWDRDRAADDLDPMPPLDRALQDELGLKVEPAKGLVKFLVIDHIEKPSEN